LLRQHGQQEIDLFDNSISSKLTGRVLMTFLVGQSVQGLQGQGLQGQGLTSEVDKGLSSGHHTAAHTGVGTGSGLGVGTTGVGAGSTGVGTSLTGAGHEGKDLSGLGTSAGLGASSAGTSDHDNLVIKVHSAHFTRDLGIVSKQDPCIKITVGHQTAKTSAKSRAGMSAVWEETLTFPNLEKLTEGKSHDVIIAAYDKDVIKDDEIGYVKLLLSELLRYQGQKREYDLFDPKDKSLIVGRVSLTVWAGEGIGDRLHHGLGEHGVGSGSTTGSTTGMSTGMSTGMGLHGLDSVAIIVHSAQFVYDVGTFAKQAPYIQITLGDHTQKTKSISGAGKTAVWDETLCFTGLGSLDTKNQNVCIRARDKGLLSDEEIGKASIPLSELLCCLGQSPREFELFDPKDCRISAGRVLLTVKEGGSLGQSATKH